METDRTILFEHIPKTAGSTFNFILSQYYPNAFHLKGEDPMESIAEFKSLVEADQKEFDLVHGHCALEVESFLKNPLRITFLRDPVDQFISQLYFIKKEELHVYHEEVSRLDSIEDYIHYAKANFQDNLQCRLLGRDQSWIESKNDAVDMDQLFSVALDQLKQFDLVLLTEYFDESLLLARQKLAWKKWPYYFRINKTANKPSREAIDHAVIRRIEALQKYDRMLYEYARQRFEALINEHDLAEELTIFQRKNRFYQNCIHPLNRVVRKIPGFRSKRLLR